jgi:hypothetical protein
MSDYNVDPVNYRGPGRYKHYKGGEYEVIGLAVQEDTVDKIVDPGLGGIQFVIYRPLTPGSVLDVRPEDFWARELGDFNEQVGAPEGGYEPRFERMT